MAETSGPWAGTDWSQADWDDAFSKIVQDGILQSVLDECQVFADSTGMQVKVRSGDAWLAGRKYKNSAQITLAIAAANPSNPRIDLVVLRMDYTAKTVVAAVKTGTASGSPTAPTLQQDTAIYEIPLAEVRVNAAVSTITAGNVTDKRVLLGTAGQQVIQKGIVTLHWTGALKSSLETVTFPTPFTTIPYVVATPKIYGLDNLVHVVEVYDESTTNFKIYGEMRDGSTPGSPGTPVDRQATWVAFQ